MKIARNAFFRSPTFIAVLFALLILPGAAWAAISGTRSVGPTGDYASLTAAIADVQAQTLNGPLVLELQAAYGSGAETFPLNFTNLTTTATNTLTVRPQVGATNLSITSAAVQTVNLDNGSFVTFDGRAGGVGTTRNLTIENTSTTGIAVQFVNGAAGNSVKFVNLRGSNTSTTAGIVVFAGTTGASGNNSNTLDSCDIAPSGANLPTNGIFSEGTTGAANTGNTVSNCTISDFFSAASTTAGVLVGAENEAWTISGNRVFQTATRTFTTGNTHAAIRIGSGNGHTISGNVIGFATAAGTGTWTMSGNTNTRFIALDLAVGTTTATSVQGNTMSGFSLGTTSSAATANGAWCGINITAGNVNIGTVTPNTIGGATGADLIVVRSSNTGALAVGINSSSTGTIDIAGNTIGGLTSANASIATVAGNVTGVNVSGAAASMTIRNNTIGNTTANNMRGGTSGFTTGSPQTSGVNIATAPVSCNVSGNTIQNLASFGTGSSGFVRGIWTPTTIGSPVVYTVSNNTIHDLQTASTFVSIANGQTAAAGICLSSGTNSVVSGNTIFNIARTNTATAGGFVVGIAHANANNSTISGNRIYALSNASTSTSATTPGVAAGIVIRSGTTAVAMVNNMISLGTGQTTDTAFIGIMANHGSTPDPVDRIYHNTIHIAGTATAGAQPSFGFARTDFSTTAKTATVDFRNNIVTNTRSGGTGQHFAIANNYGAAAASTTGWGAGAADFNVLNANPATIGHWTSAQTFANWKTASAGDASSYSGITVNYVNAANDLHLAMGITPTTIESGGTTIASVTTDFDAQARPGPAGSVNGGGVFSDIGADEFDGVYIDAQPPVITFTPLIGCRTIGATLSNVAIADTSGVPTTGAPVPRIYYRKGAGAWFSRPGTLTSGTGKNGQWSFPIVPADMGGLAGGDVISYYLIAQDTAVATNLRSSPAGVVATNVNSVSTPPVAPQTVTVFNDLAGDYTVGAGGAFSTLTAAVANYNGGFLTGPVTFTLTDSAYAGEVFPIVINRNSGASATNTLTIKPAPGVQPVISGSSATSIIQFNGATYVTLDGHNGTTQNSLNPRVAATRDLTITNTSTSTSSAVVWLNTSSAGDAATHCAVQNCIVSGSGPTATNIGLGAGGVVIGSVGTRNDDLRFINNDIRACRTAIHSSGASVVDKNQGIVIAQNVIATAAPNNIGRIGVFVGFTDGVVVTANTIGGITNTASFDLFGITIGYGNDAASTATGTLDGATNATVTENTIGSITHIATYSAIGIALGSATTGTSLIANNMISGVAANSISGDIAAGILLGGGAGAVKVYHNTVAMQGIIPGVSAGTQTSTCLAVTAATAPAALDVRNNIFSNTQVGNTNASLRFTAIALGYGAPYTGMISNHNLLYAAGAGPGTYTTCMTGGVTTGTNRLTLADWQTETAQDANSLSLEPAFFSASDLHLVPENQAVVGAGVALAQVTTDIDLNPRNAKPDIGADEFFPSANTKLASLVPGVGALAPVFDNATFAYTVNVSNATESITFTPAVERSSATIQVNGSTVASGATSAPIALAEGDNIIPILVTAQDGTTQQTTNVTVHRNAPPVLTLPASPFIVEATSSDGAVVNFTATASDLEDGPLTPDASPASGSTFALGDTTVNVSATDSENVTTTGSFTVKVRDTTAPAITGTFTPLIIYAGALPDYRSQAATDDLVGVTSVTQSPTPGATVTPGPLNITLTASDAAGNTKNLIFNVTVRPTGAVNTKHLAIGDAAPGAGTNGLPADAKLTGFNAPAVDDAGNITFIAKWASATGGAGGKPTKGTGLFLGDTCLAIVGGDASAVAGTGAKWSRFTDPVVDDGIVLTIATFSGVPKNSASAVVSNSNGSAPLNIIARAGDNAPIADGFLPVGGAVFKSFKTVSIRDGAIGFLAQRSGGTAAQKTTAANDMGLWVKNEADPLKLVTCEGQTISGKTIKTLVSFKPGKDSPGQGRGWLTKVIGNGGALALATMTDKSQAIVSSDTSGSASSIFYSATGITGANRGPAIPGTSFASYSLPAANDRDTNVFLATLKVGAGGVTAANARGIFQGGYQATYTPLARITDPAGATGTTFSALGDPVLSANDGIAFTAALKPSATIKGSATKTLWWKPSGKPLALLAQGGAASVADLPNAQWNAFTSLAIADRGPIFAATLVPGKGGITKANASGVWACDFTGTPRALFRTGDTINGKKLATFTLLKATVGNEAVTRSFNNTAQVVWLATFTDKSSAIITTEVP